MNRIIHPTRTQEGRRTLHVRSMTSSLIEDGTMMGDVSRFTTVLVLFAACASARRFWIIESCSYTRNNVSTRIDGHGRTYLEEHNIVFGVVFIVLVRVGLDHMILTHSFVAGARAVVVIWNI